MHSVHRMSTVVQIRHLSDKLSICALVDKVETHARLSTHLIGMPILLTEMFRVERFYLCYSLAAVKPEILGTRDTRFGWAGQALASGPAFLKLATNSVQSLYHKWVQLWLDTRSMKRRRVYKSPK
jgi:hypothetical protein